MPAEARAKTTTKARVSATPQWYVFAAIASMTFMLCMAINLRAFSEMNVEIEQNARLSLAVEQLTNETIGLQGEVHSLKTDSNTVAREARKMGMSRPNEKILVPIN